uniref:SAP domain-containing protein n=1 Tax=Macaca nemestrina TaxID=9545 RepID=A0A2K6CZS0_MACNE
MSALAPAAEGEGTPTQPASEKEPEMPGKRKESHRGRQEGKKKVERLTMQVSSLQREPFTIAQGKGQKLCEIERIHFFLCKKKTDEVRNLHKLLYNRPGTVSSLKKNVGQFSGFPFEKGSVQYKNKEEMLKKFRNAMLKNICEVLDLERSGVNSELVKRILNFLMHPKPSGKPYKGSKKERNSSGMARKAKRTKCPEILSDESNSDEDEKKNKEESSDDEDKESEEEPPKKIKATSKSKKSVKSANVKKADSSTQEESKQFQKESESEDSSDDEPLIKKKHKEITGHQMKQICKKVYENYPIYDLTERKYFIKTTVKELIS